MNEKNHDKKPGPLERYNEWVRADRAWIDKHILPIWGEATLRAEIAKQRLWIEANPRKGNKKDWRRFITGWMNKCGAERERIIATMSAKEESTYYATKQRSRGVNRDFTLFDE